MDKETNLSECPNTFDFLHERASDFFLQHIMKETTEQLAVIFEALERDFFRDIVRRVRHCI